MNNYLTRISAATYFVVSCMMPADLCEDATPTTPKALPEITLWHGDSQRFGHLGDTQPLINVLGAIKPSSLVADAYFQINGGRHNQMVLGPDLHRLAKDGDFNLEIDRNSLKSGENKIQIVARSPLGKQVQKEVLLNYEKGVSWSLPYEVDFSTVTELQEVVEVIDGKWELTKGGVRIAEPYYDRQLAFGDGNWQDYELHAELIIHQPLPEVAGRKVGGPPYLSHSHTSFNLRWGGHPEDGFLPRRDWMNLGSLVALRSDLAQPAQGSYWWMHFGRGVKGLPAKRSLIDKKNRILINAGDRYHYRMRVETLAPTESRYSTRIWKDGDKEPGNWQLQSTDQSETITKGAVVFVVHHSDVTLCRVRVEPLDSGKSHSQ